MGDLGTRPDRRSETRLTVIEVEQRNFGRRFDEHLVASGAIHADLQRLIGELDRRADRQDVMTARLLAGLAVLMVIGQVVAPAIARMIGLPT